jgi:hypothetical protein
MPYPNKGGCLMKHKVLHVFLVVALLMAVFISAVSAKGTDVGYQTGFVQWRGADEGFAGWALSGVHLGAGGALEFQPTGAVAESDPYAPGAYDGHNYYNGGSFFVGEAVSPVMTTAFNFKEAITSWNATTPVGTWIEVQIAAQYGTRWSKWYTYGVWAADYSTVERHSVSGQSDTDGAVYIDTFVSSNRKVVPSAFQIKVRLFSVDGVAAPSVSNIGVAYSTSVPRKDAAVSAGNPFQWNTLLNVPECSQMVYPDGGNVWCSPTSTSMVLGYWNHDTGPCEPRVRAAVDGVFDWKFNGHGNWVFNTAYASTQGYEAYVARFTSMTSVEAWVKAGVPVVISVAWGKGDLTGASVTSTAGHLMVVVGFDASGNPIVNDPAAASDAEVQRTYLRSELEPLWLAASGGTVYLIYPASLSVPALP